MKMEKSNLNKYLVILLSLTFILGVAGCNDQEKTLIDQQNTEIYNLVEKGDVLQAKEKAKKYYSGEELERAIEGINITADIYDRKYDSYQRNDITQSADISPTNTNENNLTIQQGWKSNIEDGYIYINGSVTNNSNSIISYYEITAKYLDKNNNVVHSNYTNSIEELYPNESREFEIMNKYNEYEYIQLTINEVKFK
jgi:hypothetical protein